MFKKINAYLDEHGGGIFIIDDLLWDWVPISDCNAKFCSWGFFKDFISSVVQFPLCLFSLCVVINMNNLDGSYRNYKLVRVSHWFISDINVGTLLDLFISKVIYQMTPSMFWRNQLQMPRQPMALQWIKQTHKICSLLKFMLAITPFRLRLE